MIRDRNIDILRKRIYYFPDATSLRGSGAATYGASGAFTTAETITSTPSVITGFHFQGLQVTTVNDGFDVLQPIPYDLDPTFPIYVLPYWTKDATGTTHLTSATWAAVYKAFSAGDALADAATALTTTIPAVTVTATDSLLVYGADANKGIITAADIATNIAQKAWLWAWRITLSAATTSFNDKLWLLAVEVSYMPRRTYGPGSQPGHNRLRPIAPFGPLQTYIS